MRATPRGLAGSPTERFPSSGETHLRRSATRCVGRSAEMASLSKLWPRLVGPGHGTTSLRGQNGTRWTPSGDGQPCGTRTSRGRRVATTASPGPLPENVTTQVSRLVSIPLIHGKTPNATKRYPHKAYPIGTRSYVLLASTRYYPVRGSGKHMRKIPFCGAPLRSTETMQSRIPMAQVTA